MTDEEARGWLLVYKLFPGNLPIQYGSREVKRDVLVAEIARYLKLQKEQKEQENGQ